MTSNFCDKHQIFVMLILTQTEGEEIRSIASLEFQVFVLYNIPSKPRKDKIYDSGKEKQFKEK